MKMDRTTRINLRLQSSSTGMILAALLALMAYASHRYPVRWDWTMTHRHTLAEQSIKAIQAFPKEISATAYVQEQGDQRAQLTELLEKYRTENQELRIHLIDPDLNPAAARQADVTTYGTIVLRSGEKMEKVTETTEESVTNALIRLSKGGSKTIGFITGHGEHSLLDQAKSRHEPDNPDNINEKTGSASRERLAYSDAATLLKGEGYQITTLHLAAVEKVPAETSVVILAGPRTPLLPIEVERLQQWLDGNGRMLLMNDPNTNTGLETLLKSYGVTLLEGTVIDPVARLFGGGLTTPLVNQYDKNHPITRGLQAPSFFPEARGLNVENVATEDPTQQHKTQQATIVRLLSGAERGWLKIGAFDENSIDFNAATDQQGPILLGATIQKDKQRLVVLGDSDFAADAYIGFSGNADLFLNMVRWLAEDENFIAIKPKEVQDSGLVLSQESGILLFLVLVFGIPIMLLVTGFSIWRKRKLR